MMILHNLITSNQGRKSKDDHKMTELDVVTMRIRYRVNEVLYFNYFIITTTYKQEANEAEGRIF